MSNELDEARRHLADGRPTKALDSLWDVYNRRARSDISEARGLLEVASTLSKNSGASIRCRREAELLVGHAQGFLQRLEPHDQPAGEASMAGESHPAVIAAQPGTRVASAVPAVFEGQSRASVSWAYGWTSAVAGIAIVASILSVIGGIVLGIVLARYTTTDDFGLPQTAHHGGVVLYWIIGGMLSAALWMALAVGVELLADIGTSLRDLRLNPVR